MSMTPEDMLGMPSIKLQSPLAIVGAFIYIVRQRFAPGNNVNWTWLDNKADTDILIEAQYEPNTEVGDVTPGVYIDKDQTAYGQIVVGNRDQNQPSVITRRLEHFISFATTDIIIDCVSPAKGESSEIADAVQQYLHMSSRIIMAVFGFRSMSPVILNRTVAYEKQDTLFNTPLMFRVEYEVRWATVPAAPVLKQLGLHLAEEKDGVNTVLSDIYLKSLTP